MQIDPYVNVISGATMSDIDVFTENGDLSLVDGRIVNNNLSSLSNERTKKLAKVLKQSKINENKAKLKTLEQQLATLENNYKENKEKQTDKMHQTYSELLPKVESLESIVIQAIKTDDKQLLTATLKIDEQSIIEKTVQRIPSVWILKLLGLLVTRLQANPSNVVLLSKWLRCVLLYHTSFLLTLPQLPTVLQSLYQLLDQRLQNFHSLLMLQGRLELLLSRVPPKRNQSNKFMLVFDQTTDTFQANLPNSFSSSLPFTSKTDKGNATLKHNSSNKKKHSHSMLTDSNQHTTNVNSNLHSNNNHQVHDESDNDSDQVSSEISDLDANHSQTMDLNDDN